MKPMLSLIGGSHYLDKPAIAHLWDILRKNMGAYADGRIHLFPAFGQMPFAETLQDLPRKLHLSLESPSDAIRDAMRRESGEHAWRICEFEGFHSTDGQDSTMIIPVDHRFVPEAAQAAEAWRHIDALLGEDSMTRGGPSRYERAMGLTSEYEMHISPPNLGEVCCNVCGQEQEEDWLFETFDTSFKNGWPEDMTVKTACGHETTLNKLDFGPYPCAPLGVSKFFIKSGELLEHEELRTLESIFGTPLRQLCIQI